MTIVDIERELAALETLPQMSSTYYGAAHAQFEAASDQQSLLLRWFAEHARADDTGQRVAVLSVGCGSGMFDRPLVEKWKLQTPRLSYVGVDPNAPGCAQFAEGFRHEKGDDVRIEVHAVPFGAYVTAMRFDVVHFVQSIYYVPEPAAALTRALNLLKPDGKLVVAVAPAAEMNQIAERFWEKQWGRPACFAENVCALLDAEKLPYDVDVIDARLDVTSCFDSMSAQGGAILDFLVQGKTADLPRPLQAALRNYVRAISTETSGGTWLAPHPVWVLTVRPKARHNDS